MEKEETYGEDGFGVDCGMRTAWSRSWIFRLDEMAKQIGSGLPHILWTPLRRLHRLRPMWAKIGQSLLIRGLMQNDDVLLGAVAE